MKYSFQAGDDVICISVEPAMIAVIENLKDFPVMNKVYTVKSIGECDCGGKHIIVELAGLSTVWEAAYFEKLNRPKIKVEDFLSDDLLTDEEKEDAARPYELEEETENEELTKS